MYGWLVSESEVTGGPSFVINPEMLAALLLTDFMQLSLGLGYRFVTGTGLEGYSYFDFWGLTAAVQVKF